MESADINLIRLQIDALPQGGITYKTISGKRYAYYQWREDGKQRSRRVHDNEFEQLSAQIEERKKLQETLMQLDPGYQPRKAGRKRKTPIKEKVAKSPEPAALPAAEVQPQTAAPDVAPKGRETPAEYQLRTAEAILQYIKKQEMFHSYVRTEQELAQFVSSAKDFPKRACLERVLDYINHGSASQIFLLYGMRKTGKTTLIRQAILAMTEEQRKATAYVTLRESTTVGQLESDLRLLAASGIQYVFLDEIAGLSNSGIKDFANCAYMIAEVLAEIGVKAVLAGSNIYQFLVAEKERLYGRALSLNSTYIPFSDYSDLKDVDSYLMNCGVMEPLERSPFATAESISDYIKNAVSVYMADALEKPNSPFEFKGLRELAKRGELEMAIDHVVRDMNQTFAIVVMMQNFADPWKGVRMSHLAGRIKDLFDHRSRGDQNISGSRLYKSEIKKLLDQIGMTEDLQVVDMTSYSKVVARSVFTQPGIRYRQSEWLIRSLLEDAKFRDLDIKERREVAERILHSLRNRMLSEMVLLETRKVREPLEVFVLQFDSGSYDMVVQDKQNACCDVYRIINSSEIGPDDYAILFDSDKIRACELRYGIVQKRCVLYHGPSADISTPDGGMAVQFKNVTEYLNECR